MEGEAVIEEIHSAEGEYYVTGNADTAGRLHAKEQTTHPTAVPELHFWHVIIVHLATGTNTEEARQGPKNRWAHACTTLHKGLQKTSLTGHTLQPAPTTAKPHTGTAPPTGVWTYTRTLHRGAAEAHHLQAPNPRAHPPPSHAKRLHPMVAAPRARRGS